MRGAKGFVGLVLTGMVLAGCGGGTPVVHPTTHGPTKTPADTLARLTVPSAYDASRGWQQVFDWVPDDAATVPVATAPGSNSIVLLARTSGGYTTQARNADTGAVLWTSRPWTAPAPMTDPVSGESTGEIPDVVTVHQDGRDYVVAYAHGIEGKDALHKGKEVVKLEVYADSGSGSAVAPLRELTVPVQAEDSALQVRDGGHGLLITWGAGTTTETFAAAVDVAAGRTTRYDDVNSLLPQCKDLACTDNTVAALTAKGPVVALGSGGFGVPGGWFGTDVAPRGAATGGTLFGGVNGTVSGAAGEHVVARWAANADQGDIWSVHGTATGTVEASVDCPLSGPQESEAEKNGYTVALSGNGRYVVAGPVAFDLSLKKGFCLSGDDDTKPILLESVGDDGTAYGTVDDGDTSGAASEPLAQYSLATGKATALRAGTQMPYALLAHSAMFLTHDAAHHIRVSVLRRR